MKDWLKPRTVFALIFYVAFIVQDFRGSVSPALSAIVNILFGYWFGQNVNKQREQK